VFVAAIEDLDASTDDDPLSSSGELGSKELHRNSGLVASLKSSIEKVIKGIYYSYNSEFPSEKAHF
jgi:hypothetical protein